MGKFSADLWIFICIGCEHVTFTNHRHMTRWRINRKRIVAGSWACLCECALHTMRIFIHEMKNWKSTACTARRDDVLKLKLSEFILGEIWWRKHDIHVVTWCVKFYSQYYCMCVMCMCDCGSFDGIDMLLNPIDFPVIHKNAHTKTGHASQFSRFLLLFSAHIQWISRQFIVTIVWLQGEEEEEDMSCLSSCHVEPFCHFGLV